MRPRVWQAVVAAISITLCAAPAEALPKYIKKHPKGTPMKKLGRGVVNVATGVLEIPREVTMQTHEGVAQGQYPVAAFPEGLVKGILPGMAKALRRMGSGVWDIVSFPIEQPAGYDSLYEPATIFAPGNWTAPAHHAPDQ